MDNLKPDFSNSAYLLPHIHPEGRRFGIIALLLAAATAAGGICCWHAAGLNAGSVFAWAALALTPFATLLFLLAYGVFLFFRDPERHPPEDPSAVLSPADGRVSMIVETPLPPELAGAAPDPAARYTRVSVFMSVFNVHVNRLPTAGTIVRKVYTPGKFLNASLDKAPEINERCAYLVKTPAAAFYGVVQIAGLVARRILPFVEEGATLAQAERFGLIRFGSRLDVYLPPGVKPAVRLGQIMVAGETVLGKLNN